MRPIQEPAPKIKPAKVGVSNFSAQLNEYDYRRDLISAELSGDETAKS